jgi:DNA-binding response OmpR family regulator
MPRPRCAKLSGLDPDVLLLDIVLPDRSGLDSR